MAKKLMKKQTKDTKGILDLSGWNFIIFLTLAFMLLVFVLSVMRGVSQDVRTKAGLTCPTVSLPDPNTCPTGWTLVTDAAGCAGFVCETK
jgi:ABC-type lipoprotein release transport system permease subunit